MKVDNAIIMAAGTSSRFAPLSFERPKALIEVRGEILIERQIRQLREAGIEEIVIITGYMAEQFEYLKEKYKVRQDKNIVPAFMRFSQKKITSNNKNKITKNSYFTRKL